MRFLGFDISRVSKPQAQTKSVLEQVQRQTPGIFSNLVPSSPFTAALSTLLSEKNYTKSPRQMLELYRLAYHCFTFFPRAMQIRNDFLGCPEFVSDDPVLQNELNDWAEEIPIYKAGVPYVDDKGMENFIKRMHTESMKWGMSFCELKRAENSFEVTGILMAPSDRFDHTVMADGMSILTYSGSNGNVYFYELGDLMQMAIRPNGEFPWGDAMATYGEFFITKCIRFLEAELNFRERIGNPTILTTVQPDFAAIPENVNIEPKSQRETYADALKIKDALNQAHAHRMRTGKPSDITFVPKTPAKVEQIAVGQGVSGATDFTSVYEQLLSNLHLITDVPSTFLGVSTSAGIGSDKFRIEKAFLESRSESDREKAENIIYNVTDNWMLGMKVNPKWLTAYDIHWETANIDDQKLEADTKLVDAQVIAQQIANFGALLTEFGSDAANNYAEDIGHSDWFSNDGAGLQI